MCLKPSGYKKSGWRLLGKHYPDWEPFWRPQTSGQGPAALFFDSGNELMRTHTTFPTMSSLQAGSGRVDQGLDACVLGCP